MGSTNKERVLEYVWAASPAGTTNGEIQRGTGITSHQQVYLLTQELMGPGWFRSPILPCPACRPGAARKTAEYLDLDLKGLAEFESEEAEEPEA